MERKLMKAILSSKETSSWLMEVINELEKQHPFNAILNARTLVDICEERLNAIKANK